MWVGLLWSDMSPWAGAKGDDVLGGGFGHEPMAMTSLHPSEFKRKSSHKIFYLKVVYINNYNIVKYS